MQIIEHTQSLGSREVDRGFLQGLADRGRVEIGIGGLAPAAGKRDLAGPWIAFAGRALDEQQVES